MIERQQEGEKEQSRDTYGQVIYTECLKITPAGADIICLLMACLCLALCNCGKASGTHRASPHHHFAPQILAGDSLHQTVPIVHWQGWGTLLLDTGLEIPKMWGGTEGCSVLGAPLGHQNLPRPGTTASAMAQPSVMGSSLHTTTHRDFEQNQQNLHSGISIRSRLVPNYVLITRCLEHKMVNEHIPQATAFF